MAMYCRSYCILLEGKEEHFVSTRNNFLKSILLLRALKTGVLLYYVFQKYKGKTYLLSLPNRIPY